MADENNNSNDKNSRKRKRPEEWDEDEREEIEKQARLAIEEALSSSKIRTCPHCHTRATKRSGCDTIRCVCSNYYCFRCGQDFAVCEATMCHGQKRPGCQVTIAYKASKALKKRCPGLSFKQCSRQVADSWTFESSDDDDSDDDDDGDDVDDDEQDGETRSEIESESDGTVY